MAGKFTMPRFNQEDLESTQELPELPQEFSPLSEPAPEYIPTTIIDAQPVYEEAGFGPDEEYDPEDELPEDFIDTALRFLRDGSAYCGKHWKKLAVILCALVLVVIIGIAGSFAVSNADPYDDKILNNVVIADVLVGGMTKEQAVSALNASMTSAYATRPMTIILGDQQLKLDPAKVNAKLDAAAAVEAAYHYGRTGTDAEKDQAYQSSLSGNHIMAVLPYLELNTDYIRQTLEGIKNANTSKLTQPTYKLEGKVEDLSAEAFNPAASAEVLVITTGTPQVDFDADTIYNKVLDAYSLGQFQVEGQGPVTSQLPEELDMDAIYKEFYRDSVAPTLDMSDFKTIPGAYGRDFDLGEAKMQLLQADFGQEIRIPMTYPAPEGDPSDVLYRDVLGEFRTAVSDDEEWNQNMKLACSAIHNTKLNPGEYLSLNAVLGKRTSEKGYRSTTACPGSEKSELRGAGVCQVASTLYVTALLSDLEVTARSAHLSPVGYTDYGMDAHLEWDGADFSFRNSSIYPIRVEAEVSGGYLKIRILGTDLRNYTVEMEYSIGETIQHKIIYQEFPYDNDEGYEDGDVLQEGVNGYQVKTYKRKFSKDSRELVSREYVTNSSYASSDKIIARVAPPVVEEEEVEPTDETIDLPDYEDEDFEDGGDLDPEESEDFVGAVG